MISAEEYSNRRNEVFSQMKDNSIALFFSGCKKIKSNLTTYPFEVDKDFYYLTGICSDNAALMLVKTSSEMKEFLFLDEANEAKSKFVGQRISLSKGSQISGVENTLLISSLNSRINYYLSSSNLVDQIEVVYFDDFDSSQLIIFDNLTLKEYVNSIYSSFTNVDVSDIHEFLIKQRMIKSIDEVNEIKEAIRRNVITFQSTLKSVMPNSKLYEVGISYIENGLSNGEYDSLPIEPLLAINEDACLLKNNNAYGRIKPTDFVLIDGASQSNLYCSRLCRCVPASGKFDNVQAKIYSIVLSCQKAIMNACVPGISFNELQNLAYDYLAQECIREKLIVKKEDIRLHIYHNVVQHIGLDIPDVCSKNFVVNKGNVLSISPALYFPELKVGVRITDIVFVGGQNVEILSSSLMKEISEIEDFYKLR